MSTSKAGRRRWPRDAHLSHEGKVYCVRQHADVDIEECLACGSLRQVVDDGTTTYVRCAPERDDLISTGMAVFVPKRPEH